MCTTPKELYCLALWFSRACYYLPAELAPPRRLIRPVHSFTNRFKSMTPHKPLIVQRPVRSSPGRSSYSPRPYLLRTSQHQPTPTGNHWLGRSPRVTNCLSLASSSPCGRSVPPPPPIRESMLCPTSPRGSDRTNNRMSAMIWQATEERHSWLAARS